MNTEPITADIRMIPCSNWWIIESDDDTSRRHAVAAWARMPAGNIVPVIAGDTGLVVAHVDTEEGTWVERTDALEHCKGGPGDHPQHVGDWCGECIGVVR